MTHELKVSMPAGVSELQRKRLMSQGASRNVGALRVSTGAPIGAFAEQQAAMSQGNAHTSLRNMKLQVPELKIN